MNRKYIILLLAMVLCMPVMAQKKTTTQKKQTTTKTISKNAVKSKAQLQKERQPWRSSERRRHARLPN